MDDDLPKEYDVIVLGTGLTESVIAAALARIGQRVLHLDRNDHYGGDWSTFNFDGMQKWLELHKEKPMAAAEVAIDGNLVEEGETCIPLEQYSQTISHLQEHWLIENGESDVETEPLVPSNTPTSVRSFQFDMPSEEPGESSDSQFSNVDGSSVDVDVKHEADMPHILESEPGLTEENCDKETNKGDLEQAVEVAACDIQNQAVITQAQQICPLTVQKLKKQWRKFNIDLSPKLLFCRGPLVELLISSDVAKYCEFKTVSRILTQLHGKLEQVPCSRADVFSTKAVSMIEKRMLMKFLTFCMNYDSSPEEYTEFIGRSFTEFLTSRKLTPNIRHYVMHAIAMATDSTSTEDGLAAVQKFLLSLGRYGNTAFLWTLYGSGEMPQAFCRMSAVFGGIYCLRRTASHVILNSENKCVGILSDGVRFKCNWLVAEASYISTNICQEINYDTTISRGILLTNRSITEGENDEVTLLRIPHPSLSNAAVTVIELSSATYAVPEGLYMVYLFCPSIHCAKQDLAFAVDILYPQLMEHNIDKESGVGPILWSVYYNQANLSHLNLTSNIPDNIAICTGPDALLDFDCAVSEARSIFTLICPDEEFLPRAPNPEDIIYDDGSNDPPQDPGFSVQQPDDNTILGGNGPRPQTIPETVEQQQEPSTGSNEPTPETTDT